MSVLNAIIQMNMYFALLFSKARICRVRSLNSFVDRDFIFISCSPSPFLEP